MTRIAFVALTLWMLAANFAQAQMMMMSQQELKLPDAQDCPIEKPFSPQPEKIESTSEGTRIVYPMDGYVIRRIEFKGAQAPTDIEINWVPRDDPETWGTRSAQLSVKSSDECHFNWFFAPGNVPAKQIKVRSRGQISGLTVLFSDKTWDHEGNCSATELCPKLVSTSKQCEERPNSNACGAFLSLFKKLTESEQCRRSGDFSPVPGAWVCDELQQSAVRKTQLTSTISPIGAQHTNVQGMTVGPPVGRSTTRMSVSNLRCSFAMSRSIKPGRHLVFSRLRIPISARERSGFISQTSSSCIPWSEET